MNLFLCDRQTNKQLIDTSINPFYFLNKEISIQSKNLNEHFFLDFSDSISQNP